MSKELDYKDILKGDFAMRCPETCPNNSKQGVCYVQQINEEDFSMLCTTCGFTTNSYMLDGQLAVANTLATAPELYKDLVWTDPTTNLVWMPMTMLNEDGSIVFLDIEKETPTWCGMKATGKTKLGKPTLDVNSKKYFEKFTDAMAYVFDEKK